MNVPLGVQLALVACAEEAVGGEGLGVGFVVVDVPLCDVDSADADFAFGASGELGARGGENADFDALADADGAGLARRWGEWVGGHLVGCFGHCVGFEDGGVEGGFKRVEGGWGERGGAGADEADSGEWGGKGGFEEDLVDGGDGGVPVGFVGDEVFPELGGGEFGGDDDGAAGEKGGEEAGLETVDVEEGHDEVGSVVGGELVGVYDVVCGSQWLVVLLSLHNRSHVRMVLVKLRWVKGTALGLPVVPLVCSTNATSSGSATAASTALFPASFPLSFSTKSTCPFWGDHSTSAIAALNFLAALTAGASAATAPAGTITSALLMSSI